MAIAINTVNNHEESGKSFSALMLLYEGNYHRIRLLVPDIDSSGHEHVSLCADDMALHLQILECSRFTSTLSLTYQIETPQGIRRIPNLKVQVYHDARQAVVMSCCHHDSLAFRYLRRSACSSTLQWRWRTNRFLYKWLNYCLKAGHGFPRQTGHIGWNALLSAIR